MSGFFFNNSSKKIILKFISLITSIKDKNLFIKFFLNQDDKSQTSIWKDSWAFWGLGIAREGRSFIKYL